MTSRPKQPAPRFQRAAEIIRSRVADGSIKPGELVPSAARLARETGLTTESFTGAFMMMRKTGELVAGATPGARHRVAEARLM